MNRYIYVHIQIKKRKNMDIIKYRKCSSCVLTTAMKYKYIVKQHFVAMKIKDKYPDISKHRSTSKSNSDRLLYKLSLIGHNKT